jgi:regulator of cell morphogenesis and NO signaling
MGNGTLLAAEQEDHAMTTAIQEATTVRDVVVEHPEARPVLERLGIDYCCGGGRRLEDAAADHGLSLDEVRGQIAQAIQSAGPAPHEDAVWAEAPLARLIDHIEERHHAFLKAQLPRLAAFFDKVRAAHAERHGERLDALREVFDALRDEIELHLAKEEDVLFPYLRQLEGAAQAGDPLPKFPCGPLDGPIAQMETDHDHVGNALPHLRELAEHYTLPDDACESFRALYDGLQELEGDLHQHIHLENNILFPRSLDLAPGSEPRPKGESE